ncbi:MAG: hypothetical protein L3J91_00075 [Thermoplasmata archaeon]|nr:hypothetical protein [Thermoplasmata archaeon]
MTRGVEHGELARRPWEREESYRNPSMFMGRPDLPYVAGEIEALVRLIGTLPKRIPWWPGNASPNLNVAEVAYEVRTLLEPKILVVTLGLRDLYADYYLSGPGDADGRCAILCLPHPTNEDWSVVQDRTLLTRGEAARKRLTQSVLRSAASAIVEMNRHWIHAPELVGDDRG